jgi:hypothetical protein
MFPEIRISWPLLLAAVVVTLTVMVSFHLADAGQYTASRVFLEPIERMLRLAW